MHQAPPQLSPDGRFYWDGTRWLPIAAGAGQGNPLPGAIAQSKPVYGGVVVRFVAYVIDGFMIALPTSTLVFTLAIAGILGSPVSPSDLPSPTPGGTAEGAYVIQPSAILFVYLFGLLVTAGYNVFFWGGSGSTPGMRFLKLRVVDANSGGPIGTGRAIVRYVGFILAALPCWVGLIWAAFDSRAQGWHDKIASTVVVHI